MGLESATYFDDLNTSNPAAGDNFSQGDDHLRLIKSVIKSTLPGLVGRGWRVQSKSGNYTPVVNDNMTVLLCTAALTLATTAAATLGNGWMTEVYASGGAVVIDPNSSELVNGVASVTIPKGDGGILYCDGAAFYFLGSTSGTWTPADGSGVGLSLTLDANAQVWRDSGGLVHAYFGITYPATADTTNASISGLPFTSAANLTGMPASIALQSVGSGLSMRVGANGTSMTITQNGTQLRNVDLTGKALKGCAIYPKG